MLHFNGILVGTSTTNINPHVHHLHLQWNYREREIIHMKAYTAQYYLQDLAVFPCALRRLSHPFNFH